MRLIVEIRWGRARGEKATLDPGTTLRIGRGDRRALAGEPNGPSRRDLVVESDRQLALAHVELAWDGATCRMRALTPGAEILLNGEAVTEATVCHGDWIKAGETILGVYEEGHTPPRRDSGAGMTPVREAALAKLMEVDGLYAVLDAARTDRIVEILHEAVEQSRSLYDGAKGEAFEDKAPYLVALPRSSLLLHRLVEEGWGRRWGIYLSCNRGFEEVRRQLRRLLMIWRDEDGARLYFRFYDPATLRTFLPSCSPRAAADTFGPIHALFAEGLNGEALRFDPPVVHQPRS